MFKDFKFKDVISKAFDAPTLRITMFGPRGVGKTTVLTSIFKDSTSGIAGSKIYMRAANENCQLLLNYADELSNAIEDGDPSKIPASNAEDDYLFEMGILGKKPTVRLQIQDFPGEYIDKEANDYQKEQVRKFVNESDVIIVAIDTPFLMEENGTYHKSKNDPDQVKGYMLHNPEQFKGKLVLFVPLKSERYLHEGRLAQVAERLKAEYGDLKDYFITNNVASAIVPIMSLGGMELDCLADDPTGKAEKVGRFRIYEANPKYEPLFCSQPIYYLLSYIAARYDYMKRRGNILDMMKNLVMSYLTKDNRFLTQIQQMRSSIITDALGFELYTSNSIFKL